MRGASTPTSRPSMNPALATPSNTCVPVNTAHSRGVHTPRHDSGLPHVITSVARVAFGPSTDDLGVVMRIEGSVTTVSWIPSEAVTGMPRSVFDLVKVAHYDEPPPDSINDLHEMADKDAFRFANQLRAWVEVENGKITSCGYAPDSGVVMGSTTVRLGIKDATFAAGVMPEIRRDPEANGTSVKFVQTVGGRTGLPAPRHVNHPPFVQFRAPLVWTTLALTLHADGRAEFELEGASTFPRHWLYDDSGKLAAKAGLADFKEWYRHAFGKHSPWGDEDSPALVTAVETALEREMSTTIMRGGQKPSIRKVKEGHLVVEQG